MWGCGEKGCVVVWRFVCSGASALQSVPATRVTRRWLRVWGRWKAGTAANAVRLMLAVGEPIACVPADPVFGHILHFKSWGEGLRGGLAVCLFRGSCVAERAGHPSDEAVVEGLGPVESRNRG
jgi:hypothetical protein